MKNDEWMNLAILLSMKICFEAGPKRIIIIQQIIILYIFLLRTAVLMDNVILFLALWWITKCMIIYKSKYSNED